MIWVFVFGPSACVASLAAVAGFHVWRADRAHARVLADARSFYARQNAYQGDCASEPLFVIGETEPFAWLPHPQQSHAADDWEDWALD